MKFKVEIEVDDQSKSVKIKDDRNPKEIKEFSGGIHLIAADGGLKQYYVLTYGRSAVLGWALAQAFNDGWKIPFIKRMFYHFTTWINKFIVSTGSEYEIGELEEVCDKWEEEDRNKQLNEIGKKKFH